MQKSKVQIKSQKYQIDMSGKIEQTHKDTVLCLANSYKYKVLIRAKTKRQLQEVFRRNGQIRNFVLFTFCAGLSLLLKKTRVTIVTIDREYYSREPVIKEILLEMLTASKVNVDIDFQLIGRRVNAHKHAYLTYSKKEKPDSILKYQEIIEEIKMTEVGNRLKNA